MKKISSHLGEIIIALAGVVLLISSIVLFQAPIGDFFDNIVNKEVAAGNKVMNAIDNTDVSGLFFGEGEGEGEEIVTLEGDGQSFYTIAPTALSFRSSAPVDSLQKVMVNGEDVDPSNYTVASDSTSTTITLSIDYLKTLSVGSYEITVVSNGGSLSAGFSVATPEKNSYGFYYNQPYTAYSRYTSRAQKVAFYFREDGQVYRLDTSSEDSYDLSYTVNGNTITVVMSNTGTRFTFKISGDGLAMNCTAPWELTFALGDEDVVSDGEFLYVYNSSVGGHKVYAINGKQASYGAIKTNINGRPTVQIGKYFLKDNTNITSLPSIPDSVTTIGEDAFRRCTGLTNVTIPDGVTSIGPYAFSGCSNLTSITIPNSVTNISTQAFGYCTGLTNITIPDSVTSIGDAAFYGCTNLTSITIPDSVTSIGISAFKGCTGLTDITIPDSVTTINGSLFSGCTGLTSITIPDSVTTIEGNAFEGCTGLTSVTIPDSVTIIGYAAFRGCTGLTDITIPDSVISIGREAFKDCTNLTSVTFKNTNGWFLGTTSSAVVGTDVDVTDAGTNATNLTSTCYDEYWIRK